MCIHTHTTKPWHYPHPACPLDISEWGGERGKNSSWGGGGGLFYFTLQQIVLNQLLELKLHCWEMPQTVGSLSQIGCSQLGYGLQSTDGSSSSSSPDPAGLAESHKSQTAGEKFKQTADHSLMRATHPFTFLASAFPHSLRPSLLHSCGRWPGGLGSVLLLLMGPLTDSITMDQVHVCSPVDYPISRDWTGTAFMADQWRER